MGIAAIVITVALATFASARIARFIGIVDRLQALLATFVITSSTFAVALYGLALVGRMAALSVTVTVLALSIAALVVTRPRRADLVAALVGTADWILLPLKAVRVTSREGSMMTALFPLGIALALSLLAQAFLLPPLHGSETHEALVGFAAQAHGLGGAVGPDAMALLDARPQLGVLAMAWVVMSSDHHFIDVPSVLTAAPLALAMTALALRTSGDVTTGAAWALALLWMPALAVVMQTTRVEPIGAAFVLAATTFASGSMRPANAWLAGLACALAILTTPSALAPSLLLAAIVLLRVLVAKRFVSALAIVPSLLALVAVYGRNAARFGRPIVGSLITETGVRPLPFKSGAWVEGALASSSGYGFGVGYVVVPLVMLTALVLTITALKSLVGAVAKRDAWAPSEHAHGAMIVAAATLVSLHAVGDPNAASSNVTPVALSMGLVAWLGRSWGRLGREVATAVAVASLVSLAWHARWWGPPGRVILTTQELLAVLKLPDRELVTAAAIDPKLSPDVGSQLVVAQAKTREKTIGPGSIVAFSGDASGSAYALWNFHYENRVVYIPAGPDYVERVLASKATWVWVTGAERDELVAHGFTELGPMVNGDGGVVLRRATW